MMPTLSAIASRPSSSIASTKAVLGLVACDYVDARASAHQVF
jgi:hypothetical protein